MLYAPCTVITREDGKRVDKEAILVGFFQQSDVIPPSPFVGGHTGGQVGGPVVVVKMDGKLSRVQIEDVIIHPTIDDVVNDLAFKKIEREFRKVFMDEIYTSKLSPDNPTYVKYKQPTYPVDTVEMIHAYLKEQQQDEYEVKPKPDWMNQSVYNYAIRNKLPLEEARIPVKKPISITVHETGNPSFGELYTSYLKTQLNKSGGICK